jgi:aminoglycoside phosphotransferase (APT) family kinase protein
VISDPEDFTGTRPVPAQHAIDAGALGDWLTRHVEGFAGPLTLESFKGGQSNPTYKLSTPGATYVLRTKPAPKALLLPSAHAIEREFKVMHSLHGTEVPVPRMLALCEDESVIGRAFYVMAFMEGRVFWDQSLPDCSQQERAAIYDEMNRVISSLHRLAYAEHGLAGYGRPGNYFERQIGRWSKQYAASVTQPMAEMDSLMAWLPTHIPAIARAEDMTRIVHGDFRLDNLVFHPTQPRVVAVLDWELSTLGHPLADFSYHAMAWNITPGDFRGIHGLDLAGLGIPDQSSYMARYCERTGLVSLHDLQTDWNFYMAYNLFRMAAILQGIAKRVEDGTAANAQALRAAAGARPLARLGWEFAQRA